MFPSATQKSNAFRQKAAEIAAKNFHKERIVLCGKFSRAIFASADA
jgi:hypothetical protein